MDDKVFLLLEKMYSDINGKLEKMDIRFGEMDRRFDKMDRRFDKIENQLIKMENDNNNHFTALYDGYQQSIEGINAIKEEVARHEEVIIKRVK